MTVLITGANRGIGLGLFEHYRQPGTEVIGTSRVAADPFMQLDVSDPASLAGLADRLSDTAISLLICNAGVYLDKGETLDTGYAAEKWADTFATNVAGVFHTVQSFLPSLRRAKGAKIAIISSQMASSSRASGGSYIYRASKAAVLNLGSNLAVDLRADDIPVGIYHPGWVRTDMGGTRADISVDEAIVGLTERFSALSMDSTGCFLGWDGQQLAY